MRLSTLICRSLNGVPVHCRRNYRDRLPFDSSFDPFTEGASKTQLKKFSEGLKSFVQDHAHSVVAPHFEKNKTAHCLC